MYDGGRHFASLANQLYRARDDLRTAQLQLQRARSKKKTYKRGLTGRTKALKRAYDTLSWMQRDLQYMQHQESEIRTILISTNDWPHLPEDMLDVEQAIARTKGDWNRNPGWGTSVRWIRTDIYHNHSFGAVPVRGSHSVAYRAGIRAWVTFLHKWDDRKHARHTDEQWRIVAEAFAQNLAAETRMENWMVAENL